jgi:hypothetical protein
MSRREIDRTFEDLRARERRRLLFALLSASPRPVSRIAADDAAGGADERARRIALHHVHLPKLASHGFVDWDREAGEVTRGPNFAAVRPLLELFRDHADELPAGLVVTAPGAATEAVDGDQASERGTD